MSDFDVEISAEHIAEMDDIQRRVFLRCLAKISCADGHFDEREKEFIRSIAFDFGIEADETEQIVNELSSESIIQDVAQIKDKRLALELIKQLCLLAHADNELSDEETLFIGEVGQAMGVGLEKIEQISNWVIDYLVWREQGRLIFEEV